MAISTQSAFGILGVATAAMLLATSGSIDSASAASFKGETVRLIVNQKPGSSTDITTRQVAPYVEKYLPGKPKLIVENKAGGRGVLAATYTNKLKPNGLIVGVLSVIPARWAIGSKMPVDLSKLTIIGARATHSAMLTRSDQGMTSVDALVKMKKLVIFGTGAPFATGTIGTRLFFEALGIKYKAISGYRGQGKSLQAILSNEVNLVRLNADVFATKEAALKKDDIVAVAQWGKIQPDGSVKPSSKISVETIDAAWKRLASQKVNTIEYKVFNAISETNSVFFLYAMPPKTSADVAAAWSQAFKKAYADKDFLAMVAKSGADAPDFSDAATARKRIVSFRPFFSRPEIKKVLDRYRAKGGKRGK